MTHRTEGEGEQGGRLINIEIEPELSACVETKAKREYNQILGDLLNKGEDVELGERLETLRLFLESTDFGKLRNEYEKYLLQGREVKFIVYLEEGKPKYEMKII